MFKLFYLGFHSFPCRHLNFAPITQFISILSASSSAMDFENNFRTQKDLGVAQVTKVRSFWLDYEGGFDAKVAV